MDVGFAGRPGKSDPYLKCSLGKHVFNDRQNKIDDATDVDLYKCIEFNTELPGASRLVIDMMDYDQIGLSDDLIGGTIVDLEDRWFLPQWRALGEDLRSDALGAVRGAVKPLERRALYARSCKAPQGTLECWVDILTPAEAAAYPADDIALPPRMPAEIRIVVWKAREMVSMDSITHMNDLFVKCWLTDAVPQCTDIHWRAKSGKGSFNWRMKFDVDLGHNAKIIKFPHLHVQAWDQDILKWNDLIAESAIDLGRSLRKAYFFGEEVTLFRGMGGSQKAKKKQAAGEPENGESGGLIAAADAPAPREEEQLLRDGAANGNVSSKKKKGKVQQIKRKTGMCWRALGACCRLCCGRGKQAEATGADTKDAAKAELEDEDTSAFVTQFKDMTGWGDSDPADSSWLYMDKLDHETGVREPMGRICLSIRVLPKRVAVVSPAGFGRSAPNQHPYLPPPTGRLYFSLNPFIMGSQLCGPKICAQLTSCLICIAVILLAVFCQPALNALVFLLCNNFR